MLNIGRVISLVKPNFINSCLQSNNSLSAVVGCGYKMSVCSNNSDASAQLSELELHQYIKECIPSLDDSKHKGEAGRVGIVGGSLEYTGAPYFAAISALKVGADLSHVFCSKGAAPVIKSYSPELIVHPILDAVPPAEVKNEIAPWLERLHVLVIGPGLGREPHIIQSVKEIINLCRAQCKPIIIDADGLFLVTENIEVIKDYPEPGVILTPNKVEFQRLLQVIHKKDNQKEIDFDGIGSNVYILQKGATDNTYCKDGSKTWSLNLGGSGRRCGGQGDLLAGSMATFFNWSVKRFHDQPMLPAAVATYAACKLTRMCNERGFLVKGRSMVCSDMIENIHAAFDEQFERTT